MSGADIHETEWRWQCRICRKTLQWPGSPCDCEEVMDSRPLNCRGMSLRDWFAGQALAGINANPSWDENGWVDRAKQAYKAADAMLAEREKDETSS